MKNQSETGRTLLEIIGVLCVVGLLTMGTIKWFAMATAQMAANDLVTEVRKRAIAVDKAKSGSSNRFTSHPMTKGMFDTGLGYGEKKNVSNVTVAGYAVGDNSTSGFQIEVKQSSNFWVALVPVGKHDGLGKPIAKAVCETLLGRIVEEDPSLGKPAIGDVVSITADVGEVNCEAPPEVIKIGIKIGRVRGDAD